ncbi:PhzF family phenazine biosynthesis protein [Duganella sp. FT3S]|uniref:PhzF family phenazine biosynthesis protein n=1 Tax=Rugamonas fusca TaxID=2758568 RepID=A0A7W2EKX2_9BURK|nr:PhzF family phenazine biosynthesis protein [Rugamonas fusca]MBA5607822.1 PhzF family phenazine biosynthesis protein [Rugamonas fusca]
MTTTIQEVACFGATPSSGNAALVIQGDHGTDAQRQQFARASGRSACVFIDPVADGDTQADWVFDYVYPHARSPLCLHATLAAGRVLLSEQRPALRARTALKGQLLDLALDGGEVAILLAPQTPPAVTVAPNLPAALLAAPGLALASAPAIASVGSPKLLLEVADSATLLALRPDLARIADWGREHGVSGCYVYCRRPDGAYEGRNFNHLDPALEDTATGVAAGALTIQLGQAVTLYQGAQLGQPCLIRTAMRDGRIAIGGAARLLPTPMQSC